MEKAWVLDILKEVAEKQKSQFYKNVKNKIIFGNPDWIRVNHLFHDVFEQYYREAVLGRWYDPCHVCYSTLFAINLIERGEASKLVVPAIIMHDLGYYSSLVDKENWSSLNARIIHMQEGAALAAKILAVEDEFDFDEVERIVGMVASHDNKYLGIPTNDPDRLALRDADRAWVMHPLSFYKDWASKFGKGEDLSALDLFQSRLTSFYGSGEVYPQEWGKTERPDKEDMAQSPPTTKLAKEWRDRQFAARFYEIRNQISRDPETFRKAIEDNIRAELAVGRG